MRRLCIGGKSHKGVLNNENRYVVGSRYEATVVKEACDGEWRIGKLVIKPTWTSENNQCNEHDPIATRSRKKSFREQESFDSFKL